MSLFMIPVLKSVTYIAGKYSLRRTVGIITPIVAFVTYLSYIKPRIV